MSEYFLQLVIVVEVTWLWGIPDLEMFWFWTWAKLRITCTSTSRNLDIVVIVPNFLIPAIPLTNVVWRFPVPLGTGQQDAQNQWKPDKNWQFNKFKGFLVLWERDPKASTASGVHKQPGIFRGRKEWPAKQGSDGGSCLVKPWNPKILHFILLCHQTWPAGKSST